MNEKTQKGLRRRDLGTLAAGFLVGVALKPTSGSARGEKCQEWDGDIHVPSFHQGWNACVENQEQRDDLNNRLTPNHQCPNPNDIFRQGPQGGRT